MRHSFHSFTIQLYRSTFYLSFYTVIKYTFQIKLILPCTFTIKLLGVGQILFAYDIFKSLKLALSNSESLE